MSFNLSYNVKKVANNVENQILLQRAPSVQDNDTLTVI